HPASLEPSGIEGCPPTKRKRRGRERRAFPHHWQPSPRRTPAAHAVRVRWPDLASPRETLIRNRADTPYAPGGGSRLCEERRVCNRALASCPLAPGPSGSPRRPEVARAVACVLAPAVTVGFIPITLPPYLWLSSQRSFS